MYAYQFISHHLVLIVPFAAAALAQGIKISIRQKGQKLTIKDFFVFTYAGMPSGHSALVVSLTTIIALTEGLYSPLFAICLVFSAIIIADAMGLRNYLGQHGHTLNILVKDLKNDEVLEHRYPTLLEKIGHTPRQVLAGSVLGLIISFLFYFLFH